jgi:hypothetical protein
MSKKTYRAKTVLYSVSQDRRIMPGELTQLTPEDAEILLGMKAIEEVENGTDDRSNELGELQDRTE